MYTAAALAVMHNCWSLQWLLLQYVKHIYRARPGKADTELSSRCPHSRPPCWCCILRHCQRLRCDTAERAYLLGYLINSAPRLVMPYIGPILKVLVHKLRVVSIPLMIHPAPPHSHLQKGPVQVGFQTPFGPLPVHPPLPSAPHPFPFHFTPPLSSPLCSLPSPLFQPECFPSLWY